MPHVLCIVTGGSGDARRARRLLAALPVDVTVYEVDRSRPRLESFREIYALIRSRTWDLIFQEGTGIVGGLNLILAARQWGQSYVVSSGDPIGGFFRTTAGPVHGAVFSVYERLLYRSCAAFVGWTPYLAGLALQMGAPRAVTVEGAVDLDVFAPASDAQRAILRRRYGLTPSHLVCGVVGSIQWSKRQEYCYGLELVETLKHLRRPDVSLLIVGDGNGRAELERRVPAELADRVVFTGRVAPEEVVDTLNAMDVGFITQTLDGLGSFRLTTKLPEYLATGLPVAMSPIPGYFDYVGDDAGWALPAHHPASEAFHRACAAWLDGLDRGDANAKRSAAHQIAETHFASPLIPRRFAALMSDLLDLNSLAVSEASLPKSEVPDSGSVVQTSRSTL